jgi:hypothetical protein
MELGLNFISFVENSFTQNRLFNVRKIFDIVVICLDCRRIK